MIEGLRQGYHDEIDKKKSGEKNEGKVKKLQMEQIRLTGVELSLRRELESCRLEVDSLRHENIDLWNSLNGTTNDIGGLTFKLDKEIQNRICCLQDQGLSMLNESTHLSSKLIEFIKGKASHNQLRVTQQGLDGQFLIESDMKVWGFKRRIQNLARNLETNFGARKIQFSSLKLSPDIHESCVEKSLQGLKLNRKVANKFIEEKLYSKELEVEQLQAEVSAAVRGNDILRCEVQNAMDNISCLTHRLKDLGLQMLKKDENEICIWNDLQESNMSGNTRSKAVFGLTFKNHERTSHLERGIANGFSERDLTWEEVKQYAEKNMVLNSEINALKKKIEGLDDDILLKEGQITILKDTLNNNNKSIDLLGSVDSISEFLLQ
ncbi:uncharacterized protein [Gossypium hirsutum]|uniref:DUF7653 domain-containing protein n=1 Tax=Gossypium hirsutum TaxID=3635 RepID=A0ABM3BWG8_GOSHI|nr:uncharacterized protein LOC121230553 [Gossypium hirsutum]